MARTSQPKRSILKAQETQRQSTNQISAMVQQLRLKPDWVTKIADPTIRAKYCAEAVDQGLPLESVQKALSILDTMAQCQLPVVDPLKKNVSEGEEEVLVSVVVGGTEFPTSISILTADPDSMLTRMFRPPWLKPPTGEAIPLETASNSPHVFALILTYLQALANHQTNLCPNLNTLSSDDLASLCNDCDYLGLDRLSTAIAIANAEREKEIALQQEKAAKDLAASVSLLQSLIAEKARIEKRLTELPGLIARQEAETEKAKEARLIPASHWSGQPGEEVMINTSGTSWEQYTLVDVEGQLMAQPSNKCKKTYWPASRQKKGPIPLPGPAFYHSVSSKWDYPCDEGTVSCLNLIPHHLTQSLEKNLDSLLHQKALDLHPGSDGQVVDLIHPSLYPYINGVTTVTDEEEFNRCEEIDGDYCWLPSEFDVDASGGVTIESYINNLDRSQHPSLYLDIAQVFQTMLPLFEDITGLSLTSKKLQVIVKAAYYFIPPGETYLGVCSSLCLQFSSLISLCLSLSLSLSVSLCLSLSLSVFVSLSRIVACGRHAP
jgi:hypothetical protein